MKRITLCLCGLVLLCATPALAQRGSRAVPPHAPQPPGNSGRGNRPNDAAQILGSVFDGIGGILQSIPQGSGSGGSHGNSGSGWNRPGGGWNRPGSGSYTNDYYYYVPQTPQVVYPTYPRHTSGYQPPMVQPSVVQPSPSVGAGWSNPAPPAASAPGPGQEGGTVAKILIVNPQENAVTLQYTLDGVQWSIPPGEEQELRREAIIEFPRGENMGTGRYRLRTGVYTFTPKDGAWELFRSPLP